ncbi:MAG: DUF1638 domain-containing protein [Phycisphaerae bacterium]|nr:DUF1638 domain-containing protein [Phycisphaerae bacterium]
MGVSEAGPPRRKFKFIGCEIIYREACYLAATGTNQVDVQFLKKGLHDLQTPDMVRQVQEAVDSASAGGEYEAILLGYARCNDGLVGVSARSIPLVLPRAHDCITFFLGSREAYREYFDAHPGTYYMTSGWSERNSAEGDGTQPAGGQQGMAAVGVMESLGLNMSHEELVEKYGADNAQFIAETLGDWRKNYSRLLYIEMGICDEGPFIEEARREAAEWGWELEIRKGGWALLKKLFSGQWDDDMLIVPPGSTIVARNDEWVLDVSPAGPAGGGDCDEDCKTETP